MADKFVGVASGAVKRLVDTGQTSPEGLPVYVDQAPSAGSGAGTGSPGGTASRALLTNAAAVGAGASAVGVSGMKTYQASGLTTAGAGAASVLVQGSNDGTSWDTIGTISLTLGTARSSDSFTSGDRYSQVRGNVASISGTGAAVSLTMGY